MTLCLMGIDGVRWDRARKDGAVPDVLRLGRAGSMTPMRIGPGHGEGEEEVRRSFLVLRSDTLKVATSDHGLALTYVVPLLQELTR